jgi:[ribosomal protein S18]-alanine N-acetyltransferase
MPQPPFEMKTYQAGTLRDGRTVGLAPMTQDAALHLGAACAAMDPWQRYGRSAERLTANFTNTNAGTFRYQVIVEGACAGAMVIVHPWLIGPYLQFIAVTPEYQSQGVGRVLLAWYERQARTAKQRNMWLCVTGFNERARAVYRADGWQDAARLPDLVANNVDEVLMRKRLF